MHLDDGLERIDAHAMKDRITQNAGIVDHAVELAETVDRAFHDLAGGNSLRDRLEICHRRPAALGYFLDHFFSRRGVRARSRTGDAGRRDHDPGPWRRGEPRNLA